MPEADRRVQERASLTRRRRGDRLALFRGPVILTNNRDALPTPSRLESAILALESRGDLRHLIGFVEAWNAVGEPTRKARLAQARAFLDLCMLDRAWIRLKELQEEDGDDVEVLKLTAAMFVRRGWPGRARKPLERALRIAPDDREVQELWDLAAAPPVEPDADLEDSTDLDVLLQLAETYLATGAMLKGQALLERLRRDHPDHPRIGDLLWVLDGNFTIGEATLTEMAERFGPDLSGLADLAEEVEHTESVAKEEVQLPLPKDTVSFPSLFRGAGSDRDLDTEPDREITTATSLADLSELRKSVEATRRSAGIVTGEEDTQIKRIIRRDDGYDVTDAGEAVHVQQTVPADVHFDLDQYRQEMGVSGPMPTLPESDLDDPLEEEDDDVVILTKREAADDVPYLEPDPTSESLEHPDAKRFLAEAEQYRKMQAEKERDTEPEEDPTATPTRRSKRRVGPPGHAPTPVWLLAIAVLLGIAAFFLAILVVAQFIAS